MTHDQVQRALRATRALVPPIYESIRHPPDEVAGPGLVVRIEYALWMIDEALGFPPEKVAKVDRWLGFIQGVLWMTRLATIDQMREINIEAQR